MALTISQCRNAFGHPDFDLARISGSRVLACPVRACSATLVNIPFGKQSNRDGRINERTLPWCAKHGLRFHAGTFAYWNGGGADSRLRNFIIAPELAQELALAPGQKAESHRLGNEMSEDALSWNVFVSLAAAGKLRDAAQFLTGRQLKTEPSLYLWGKHIDLTGRSRGLYEPLHRVRMQLEKGIGRFGTEPDIMLVVENEMVVCIEAKFASGNPLSREVATKEGEKPTSKADLLARYLGAETSSQTRDAIRPDLIPASLHTQIFRNIVFASEMAGDVPWHVANLVSRTQRQSRNDSRYSFANPEPDVCCYLHPNSQHCFTYRTWEELYTAVIGSNRSLSSLDAYLRTKSAHYERAFDLG